MTPVAVILGGISGVLSALFGMLHFGLNLWGAAQLYFAVGLSVTFLLIVTSSMFQRASKTTAKTTKSHGVRRA